MRRILACIVAATLLLLGACSGDSEPDLEAGGASEVLGDADEGIDGVKSIRVYYSNPVHAEGEIPYELHPPAGGMHAGVWWNCGFYDEPIPDENAVHDLEHGAVWLAYSPDLTAADVQVIHDLARQTDKILAAPYAGLDDGAAVVATAWARQLTLDSVEDPRLQQFAAQYIDGEQAPEHGVTCLGSPLGVPIP
jgi:hypothetical protein